MNLHLLKGSAFLKVVALVVAVLTYVYVRNEIAHKNPNAVDPSYKLIKLTAKNLPVQVRIETAPPEGYRVVEKDIIVTPSNVTVIGPEALLDNVSSTETSSVDVSEYTRTITKQVPIENVAGIHLAGEPYIVVATVPIEKIVSPGQKPAEPSAPAEAPQEAHGSTGSP
jgi:YbbR domain-containing protein